MYKNRSNKTDSKEKKSPSIQELDLSSAIRVTPIRMDQGVPRLDLTERASSSLAGSEKKRTSFKEDGKEKKAGASAARPIPVTRRPTPKPPLRKDDKMADDMVAVQRKMKNLLGPVRPKVDTTPPSILSLDDVEDRVQIMRHRFTNRTSFVPYKSVTNFSKKGTRAAGKEMATTMEEKDENVVATAKEALEKRKYPVKTKTAPKEKSDVREIIKKSSYLRREIQSRNNVAASTSATTTSTSATTTSTSATTTSTSTSSEENLLNKLDGPYNKRAVSRAQASRPYRPTLTSLKDTLYEAE